MDIDRMHKFMIYPVVRVKANMAGGSGTVIYSREIGDTGEYRSYVLTNHHVVKESIAFKDKWDSAAGREIKIEVRAPVSVEFFEYRDGSWENGIFSLQADIVAWDSVYDLALLELRSVRPVQHIANLYPRDQVNKLRIGMQTLTVGCSMGHKPVPSTIGMISSLDEELENISWWMHSSAGIYGNSGGAAFLVDSMEMIGIPSRIEVFLSGFSVNAISWLQYIVPVTRIYNWLEEVHFDFIFSSKTYEQCKAEREASADALQSAWERRASSERDVAQGGVGSGK
jgi:hypothetical protein